MTAEKENLMESTYVKHATNVSDPERWASLIGGGALAIAGVKRGGKSGIALALLGGDLVYRGLTGYCHIYQAFGVHPTEEGKSEGTSVPYELGVRVDKAVTINKPREELY